MSGAGPGPDRPTGPGGGTPDPTDAAATDPLAALSRRERLSIWATETRSRVEARRASSASIDTAFEAIERDSRSGGGVLATAVAFRLFMYLVPYAFVMVTGFGLYSSAAGQKPEDAARAAGIGGLLATAVASTSSLSPLNRFVVLIIGAIALAFTSRSLVKVLQIVHELIWAVRPTPRPLTRGALILIGGTTVLFGAIDLVVWLGHQSIGWKVVAYVVLLVAVTAAWLLASWWLPHRECEWWALLPGAVMVGVGVALLHLATVTYFAYEVSRKSSLYGAIGLSIALLLWMYFLGRLLTASIAADASLWQRRQLAGAHPPSPARAEEGAGGT